MTDLKPFQKLTVDAVLDAFKTRRRARFLVADEVGLGKTVVAQHVINRMMTRLNRPLVVFYMCSNLAIARQNRRSLLKVLPVEERDSADCPVDRLSLLPAYDPPEHPRLNLYSLTPDTSIPFRKGQRRDGRQEERALVHALVRRIWPQVMDEWNKDVFQRNAKKRWKDLVRENDEKVSRTLLRTAFAESVRQEFGLEPGQHLVPALRRLADEGKLDDLALIAHLRNALAASAIEERAPDLIIFDEFQRFRDLLEQQKDDPSAERVMGKLRGDGRDPPAVLLLSATPYRLFTRRWEEEAGVSHRKEFFDLIEFLYGGDEAAKQNRTQCEQGFMDLEEELRKGLPKSDRAQAARRSIELMLCPIMARTERAYHEQGWSDYQTLELPSPVTPSDLEVFKHLSSSISEDHRSSAVPYWTSIPLPMQTMGNHYVAWASSKSVKSNGTISLTESMRDQYKNPTQWPHPRLRALQQLCTSQQLSVPWLPPTESWWPLRGAWENADQIPRKLLIFSRFRAVPQAIASTLSFDLESTMLGSDSVNYGDVTRRRLLTATENRHALLGLFHPSPFLVRETDPLAARSGDIEVIRRDVRRQLREALARLRIKITVDAKSLPVWRLLVRLDNRTRKWEWISRAWWSVHDETRTGDDEDSGLGQLLKDWDAEAQQPIETLRPDGFELLVNYALGSPGVALGRALRRHWNGAVSEEGFKQTLEVSWLGLRSYLDQRWFYKKLTRGRETYPEAIVRAVIDGNLESVLDEHVWIIGRLQSLKGAQLAEELRDSLTLRSGMYFLHPLGQKNKTFSLRCHAAMPFVQTRLASLDGAEKPIRTDELRRAFNSPFWPYVLATTSVGQEGLDFHVWCDTLVHWDLCRNPVDLEQREGRIQRYGGLAIREAIAKEVGESAKSKRYQHQSPWSKIEELANRQLSDDSGLAPWWVCKDGNVKRYVFDVPTSEQGQWLHWMREQRLLYRLALGHPNQEDLIEILSGKDGMEPAAVRQAMLNLSPWFRQKAGGL